MHAVPVRGYPPRPHALVQGRQFLGTARRPRIPPRLERATRLPVNGQSEKRTSVDPGQGLRGHGASDSKLPPLLGRDRRTSADPAGAHGAPTRTLARPRQSCTMSFLRCGAAPSGQVGGGAVALLWALSQIISSGARASSAEKTGSGLITRPPVSRAAAPPPSRRWAARAARRGGCSAASRIWWPGGTRMPPRAHAQACGSARGRRHPTAPIAHAAEEL